MNLLFDLNPRGLSNLAKGELFCSSACDWLSRLAEVRHQDSTNFEIYLRPFIALVQIGMLSTPVGAIEQSHIKN